MIRIYNTMSAKKEPFTPITPGEVHMYVCGPTVYNLIHLGNARPLCVFDVFRRFLESEGYRVTFVQNYTDVNDKIIRQGKEEGLSPEATADKYIREFETDARGLNVLPPTVTPRVSEYIDKIIDFIQILLGKGFAYEAGGDVYFRTREFPRYGCLSGQTTDELLSGARVEINEQKEDPLDFALWKGCGTEEQHWDSPWGPGRPGWHIECSAMARDTLGETIDIHGGGQDLIFPHHENEIAQSEAASGVPFAHYWMHNGHINIDHKKMSKSLGNFFLVREAAGTFGYETIRFFMIQSHYRAPMNYSEEQLIACRASLDRLYECRDNVRRAQKSAGEGGVDPEAADTFQKAREDFREALSDDLNTADALAAVFTLARALNTLAAKEKVSLATLTAGAETLENLCGILGLLYERKVDAIPEEIFDLARQRTAARAAKNYAEADRLRDEIERRGYIIRETRQGTEIKKR